MIDTAGPKAPAAASLLPRPDRPALVRGTIIVVLLLLALFALPPLMNGYYTVTMTQVAIYSIVTLGLGLLVGRVGLYSLGQLAVLIIGAWTAARLLFGWIMSAEGQAFIVDLSGQYPANKLVKAKPGRPALASIKTWREDPVEVEKTADEIKAKYQRMFKV